MEEKMKKAQELSLDDLENVSGGSAPYPSPEKVTMVPKAPTAAPVQPLPPGQQILSAPPLPDEADAPHQPHSRDAFI